ncbi:uncharacterized protein LOC115961187 [Quercus lobata]|uniref:uncharacterized protein LOC115961187 n=1 Tax=Quercus lobata TaxID=97700 RepID=UPI0012486BE8|nr:uncharacterized protein LOC115961187 [Quercus lobata]
MAEELEILWRKLTVTDEEEESVILDMECTRATKDMGKNCLVMKVLSRRGVMLDALRKNIRMLWKPNKSIQISAIEEEVFLVEFDDERDKKRVLEMSPWHYKKQLVLMQQFEGDKEPKDLVFKWCPFWVQIYNLPLKHRTRETGLAIGASLGEVLEVDVADSGVQWGKCLCVRVKIDVTKKLIRGRKTKVEEGVDRWVLFKYERLPNFCYRCGLLEHDLKECPQNRGVDDEGKTEELQYGAWMRGDPVKKSGWESHFIKKNDGGDIWGKRTGSGDRSPMVQTPRSKAGGSEKEASGVQILGESSEEMSTKKSERGERNKVEFHQNGMLSKTRETPKDTPSILVKVGEVSVQATNVKEGDGHEEVVAGNKEAPSFNFEHGPKNGEVGPNVGLERNKAEGPMAMNYEMNVGWVAESLSPTSGHWKRRARAGQTKGKEKIESPAEKKRGCLTPLGEIDQNVLVRKRRKVEKQSDGEAGKENEKDGGEAVAAAQHRRAQ